VLLGLLPVLLWVGMLVDVAGQEALAFDFHHFFYPQARELVDGGVPQTAYPPLTTLLYVPFAVLPMGVADVAVTVAAIACEVATLALLGIRDWRCYGAAALLLPTYSAVQLGNVTPLLTLGVAAMWRYRDRTFLPGALVALMVAIKLLLWPLAVWLGATRRWRAVAAMIGIGVAASVAAWAVIGFETVTRFPRLVQGNVVDNGDKPYTLVAVVHQSGAPREVGYAVCWIIGVVVLAAAVRLGRRGLDAAALTLCVGAALLLSPVVWSHYLEILLVPIALTRPRFSRLWLVAVPLWVCPVVDAPMPQKLLLLAMGAAIVAFCARELARAPAGDDGYTAPAPATAAVAGQARAR
jgi:hypothetical protein